MFFSSLETMIIRMPLAILRGFLFRFLTYSLQARSKRSTGVKSHQFVVGETLDYWPSQLRAEV